MARLIDADAVLAKQFTAGLSDASGNYYGHSDVVFVDDIENAPTVYAVEVVHGHWLMRGGRRYCSACGEMACVTRDRDDFWYTVGTKHCPECGAKMDGDRNV